MSPLMSGSYSSESRTATGGARSDRQGLRAGTGFAASVPTAAI